MKTPQYLQASKTPEIDLAKLAYSGQPENMRMYRKGYENLFNQIPVLESSDTYLESKIGTAQYVMSIIANHVKEDIHFSALQSKPLHFNRTILGLEKPIMNLGTETKEGAEVLVAQWGDGFTSPVHGHAAGYLHEEVIDGKVRVNTYRIMDQENRVVRPLKTEIVTEGLFVSEYSTPSSEGTDQKTVLVHNFTAIGPATTLHYVPEHTRDGRDNTYIVDQFGDHKQLTKNDVIRIDSYMGMYLQKGDVVLVRSTNVPEYEDHFIIITGPPIMKDHGFRVQEVAIMASPSDSILLDEHPMKMGLTLLKLNPSVRDMFLEFHGYKMENGKVVLPD